MFSSAPFDLLCLISVISVLLLVLCPVSFTSSVPFFSCPLSNDLLLLHHASFCVQEFLLVSHYCTMLNMEFVFGLNKGLALHRLSQAPVS